MLSRAALLREHDILSAAAGAKKRARPEVSLIHRIERVLVEKSLSALPDMSSLLSKIKLVQEFRSYSDSSKRSAAGGDIEADSVLEMRERELTRFCYILDLYKERRFGFSDEVLYAERGTAGLDGGFSEEKNALFVILRGRVRVTVNGETVSTVSDGDLLNELCALGLSEGRTTGAVCDTLCDIAVVHRSVMLRALEDCPQLRQFLQSRALERVRDIVESRRGGAGGRSSGLAMAKTALFDDEPQDLRKGDSSRSVVRFRDADGSSKNRHSDSPTVSLLLNTRRGDRGGGRGSASSSSSPSSRVSKNSLRSVQRSSTMAELEQSSRRKSSVRASSMRLTRQRTSTSVWEMETTEALCEAVAVDAVARFLAPHLPAWTKGGGSPGHDLLLRASNEITGALEEAAGKYGGQDSLGIVEQVLAAGERVPGSVAFLCVKRGHVQKVSENTSTSNRPDGASLARPPRVSSNSGGAAAAAARG
ncbi:unnamed protein product, partial [Amoebophrya sp. A120]|eukprot:GSA120T00001768001.1